MDTSHLVDALPREQTVLKSRPWYMLTALLVLLSVIARQPVIFFAAGFTLVLGLLPELWYRFALRSLVISHTLSQPLEERYGNQALRPQQQSYLRR